ncbi:MAG TPA: hypothetical protein VFO50_02540 [Candidatus Limnocylindrales bacterium]|nr:hypothetical protein [Candidatus Limnocylindrales bacterium]
MHPGSWFTGREDPRADRDRAHRVALQEARFATDYRAGASEVVRTASPVRRLSLASAGSNADLAACCA